MRYLCKRLGSEKVLEFSWLNCRRWLFCFLAVIAVVSSLTACEKGAQLTVENRLSSDVMIVKEAVNREGKHFGRNELGIAPVGRTVTLPRVLGLRQDIIGWTVILKAENPSGKVVWQKSWLFREFLELEKVRWKIVVSRETSDSLDK